MKHNENSDKCNNSLIIDGIYSPFDKISHPKEAAAIARNKRIDNKGSDFNILYFNLEPFGAVNQILDEMKNTSVSDIIYFYKTNISDLKKSIYKSKGSFLGMDVLSAPDIWDDIEEIDKEGWPDFLLAISRAGDYQNIILDISSIRYDLLEVVLKNGNLFIPAIPLKNNMRYLQKYKEFMEYINFSFGKEYLDKIMEVRLGSDR